VPPPHHCFCATPCHSLSQAPPHRPQYLRSPITVPVYPYPSSLPRCDPVAGAASGHTIMLYLPLPLASQGCKSGGWADAGAPQPLVLHERRLASAPPQHPRVAMPLCPHGLQCSPVPQRACPAPPVCPADSPAGALPFRSGALVLSSNKLSGTIPEELCSVKTLSCLSVPHPAPRTLALLHLALRRLGLLWPPPVLAAAALAPQRAWRGGRACPPGHSIPAQSTPCC